MAGRRRKATNRDPTTTDREQQEVEDESQSLSGRVVGAGLCYTPFL